MSENKPRQGYVMVVDDDVEIRGLVRELLEVDGYSVLTAANGREALHLGQIAARPVVLILLDLMMPDMDGLEFRAEQLKTPALAEAPVVVMSGDTRVKERAGAVGAVARLQKPFDLNELLEIVSRYAAPSLHPAPQPSGYDSHAH